MKPKKYLELDHFAVLDERSARDRTVVLHYEFLGDDELVHRWFWRSWRVRFAEAASMSIGLTTPSIAYEVYLEHGDRFVDEDGILAVEEAEKKAPFLRRRCCCCCCCSGHRIVLTRPVG